MIPSNFTHAQGFDYRLSISDSHIHITLPEFSSECWNHRELPVWRFLLGISTAH